MTAISNFTGEHGFLSNFHVGHPVMLPGWSMVFPTAEHAYQAAKAMSSVQAQWVRDADSPAEAKRRGRKVVAWQDWERMKKKIMLAVLLAKFSDLDLAQLLVTTSPATLVEGNTWGDDYWGAVPYDGPSDHWATMLPIWQAPVPGQVLAGHNWLGRLLMVVRDVMAP